MRPKYPTAKSHHDLRLTLRPVLDTIVPTTHSCAHPMCAACQLARLHRQGSGTSTEHQHLDKFMSLKRDDLRPGQAVSLDQYQYKLGGCLPNTFGKEREED